MFNRDEKGQSVILIAVSIVLVIVVAFSVYNLQMLLVAKQKLRQLTDSTALAGALSRKTGLETYLQLSNLDILVAASWEIGLACDNLLKASNYVHSKASGYDDTADILATSTLKNLNPVQNHISHVITDGVVEPETYSKAQHYIMLESLLYGKNIQDRNYAISTFPSTNHMSLLIPSEMIVNQGAVLSYSEANYHHYEYEIGQRDGRMLYSIKHDNQSGQVFETTIGLACLELVDSPSPLFSSILSSLSSNKLGKMVAFAYAYPYAMEDIDISEYPFEPLDSFVDELGTINAMNTTRVETIKNLAKKKKPSAQDIAGIKAAWDLMVADYNSFLNICDQQGLLYAWNISTLGYQPNPVMGSLQKLNLLGSESYQDTADFKGIDWSSENGKDTFYKTLTLQDVFQSKEKFWQDLQTTYETIIDNNAAFASDLNGLINDCKFFDVNHANDNNVPSYFKTFSETVYESIENSTLDDFLTLSTVLSDSIVSCYNHLEEMETEISSAPYTSVDSLMPSTTMMDYLTSIFTAPIVRWEGS